MLSKKEFQILSGKTGFIANYLEKVYRILALLNEISKSKELMGQIALKGGTAINHFVFKYPRLSIDLDFDYLIPVAKEELDVRSEKVKEVLKRIFRFQHYEISENKLIGHHQYYLKYQTQFGSYDTIKVEINYLLRQHLAEPEMMSPLSPFDFSFKMKVLAIEEVYAAKCTALLDRGTPRDLFDVYYFIEHKEKSFDTKALRRIFLFYASISRRNMKGFISDVNIVERITEKEIKNNLWMLLNKKNRPKRSEMMKTVLPFMRNQLKLTKSEQKFFDLFGREKPNFGLIYDDKDLAAKLSSHPMVLWRLQKQK